LRDESVMLSFWFFFVFHFSCFHLD
jgi:hypothetical protein